MGIPGSKIKTFFLILFMYDYGGCIIMLFTQSRKAEIASGIPELRLYEGADQGGTQGASKRHL
jgi:hypothetical protein